MVLYTRSGMIREPIISGQLLNAVVLESRAVPTVGAALQHSIGDEAAALSVFGGNRPQAGRADR